MKLEKYLLDSTEATFDVQLTKKMVRIFVLIKFRIILNLVLLASKIRLVGQITEIPCGHSRNRISCSIDLKISQNFSLFKSGLVLICITWSRKLGNKVKLQKYLLGTLEATIHDQLT